MTAHVSVSFGASFLVPDIVLHKRVFLSSLQQCQFLRIASWSNSGSGRKPQYTGS